MTLWMSWDSHRNLFLIYLAWLSAWACICNELPGDAHGLTLSSTVVKNKDFKKVSVWLFQKANPNGCNGFIGKTEDGDQSQ
jgi:hypothetical protein